MLGGGADPSRASIAGVTPLMAASYAGNVELVRRLLAAGARVDAVDRMNKPAAVYAAGQGNAAVVEALLSTGGIDVDAAYEHRLTLLMWAAGQGQAEVVTVLLAHGARTDLRDDRGMRAEDIARDAQQPGVAELLARKAVSE
jgi:ankyrin repeat protein